MAWAKGVLLQAHRAVGRVDPGSDDVALSNLDRVLERLRALHALDE